MGCGASTGDGAANGLLAAASKPKEYDSTPRSARKPQQQQQQPAGKRNPHGSPAQPSPRPSPLPEAFRECRPHSTEPSKPPSPLTVSQISDMLGEIHCCVEDQTDLAEAREGEEQLKNKAEAMERLVGAREMRDMGLLRREIDHAMDAGVSGLSIKMARRLLKELELDAVMESAMRGVDKDNEKLQRAVDQAEALKFHSRTLQQAQAYLAESKENAQKQKQVEESIAELMSAPVEAPHQLLLTERAVRAAQYAKLNGEPMRMLIKRRRTLRDRANQAEAELEALMAVPPKERDAAAVGAAFELAKECDVSQQSLGRFEAVLARESLEEAIIDRDLGKLRTAIKQASEAQIEHEAGFMRASEMVEEITGAQARLLEGRRLRAEGAQARVAHEMKKKADEVQAKKARKRERAEARRLAAEAQRAADRLLEEQMAAAEAKRKAEADAKAAEEAEERAFKRAAERASRPVPKFPTGDWLDKSMSRPNTSEVHHPAALDQQLGSVSPSSNSSYASSESRSQQPLPTRAPPSPAQPEHEHPGEEAVMQADALYEQACQD